MEMEVFKHEQCLLKRDIGALTISLFLFQK